MYFFIKKLLNFVKSQNFNQNDQQKNWLKQCLEWKTKYDPVKKEFYNKKNYVHPYVFIRTLSKKMKSNSVFVADCGGNIIVCNHSFETKKGQRYFTNNGNSPMGFSFSGAMGAYFANTKRPVICVIGDGGMNMNIQELQTIKNYNIKGVINLGAKDKISKGKFLFKIGKKLNTKRKFTFQNVENLNFPNL